MKSFRIMLLLKTKSAVWLHQHRSTKCLWCLWCLWWRRPHDLLTGHLIPMLFSLGFSLGVRGQASSRSLCYLQYEGSIQTKAKANWGCAEKRRLLWTSSKHMLNSVRNIFSFLSKRCYSRMLMFERFISIFFANNLAKTFILMLFDPVAFFCTCSCLLTHWARRWDVLPGASVRPR